jgi:hypothetical protein
MIVRHHQSVWRYRGFEHCSSGYESSRHTWVNHGNHPIPIPIPKPIYLHAPESQICDFSPAPWNQWLVSGGVCQMNRGVGFVRTGTCRALNPLMMRHSNEGVSENCCTCTCPNKWHFHAGNSLISLEKNGTWWSSWVDLGVAMGSRVADFFFPMTCRPVEMKATSKWCSTSDGHLARSGRDLGKRGRASLMVYFFTMNVGILIFPKTIQNIHILNTFIYVCSAHRINMD